MIRIMPIDAYKIVRLYFGIDRGYSSAPLGNAAPPPPVEFRRGRAKT